MSTDAVVVVGAGPTGLVLACALSAQGVPVRLLDAASGPATTSRALGLQPRGVKVLDRLGALGDLPTRSLPVNRVHVSVSGRPLARLAIGQQTRLDGRPGLLVSQTEIEAELRHRLMALGVEVEWGRRVTALTQDPDRVTLRLEDGATLQVPWLAGCDGAHSAVRKAAGIAFPGVPLVERFFLADARLTLACPRDAVSVWLRGEAMLAAFPLPGADLWRLMAPGNPQQGGAADEAAIVRRLGARLHEETGRQLSDALWTSSFQIHRRLADRYRSGRVLLAGDAAHVHSPLGGQGMNTGMGDAENLAWKLGLVCAGLAQDRLLDSYEAERRPIATEVLKATSGATGVMFGSGRWARIVRDRVVVPLFNQPLVQRRIAETSSQLLVSYRRGPLGAGRASMRRPCAGDRVKDLRGTTATGPSRLYELLRGGWVLAAPAGHPAAQAAERRLGHRIQHLVVEQGEALLVRPDAHLAWRGDDPDRLERCLDHVAGLLPDGVS